MRSMICREGREGGGQGGREGAIVGYIRGTSHQSESSVCKPNLFISSLCFVSFFQCFGVSS